MTVVAQRAASLGIAARRLGRPAVAVITQSPQGGGVAYIARLLTQALGAALGEPPAVLSLDQIEASNVSASRKLRFAGRLLTHSALKRSDWIIFGHPGIASAQQMIPRPTRLPCAIQLHGTDAWDRPPSRAVIEATLRIAPSRYTIERTQATYPEIGPIELCPHGLLPRPSLTGAPDFTLLSRVGPASVLILGRVSASEGRKGHDQLLECWPRVLETVPQAQLVIAGEGDDIDRLKQKARGLGIAERVVFCGYVSDATREALFGRSGMFAMPSQQEGFGLVYLEAMRAALPCVGALDDGAMEPIVDGETGFLVPQSDREALANAIVTILRDHNLRRRFGEAGRKRFDARYTFEAYRARLIDVLSAHFMVGGSEPQLT
jgi:phosphatidyl-myo-inositol dimannoside synthase